MKKSSDSTKLSGITVCSEAVTEQKSQSVLATPEKNSTLICIHICQVPNDPHHKILKKMHAGSCKRRLSVVPKKQQSNRTNKERALHDNEGHQRVDPWQLLQHEEVHQPNASKSNKASKHILHYASMESSHLSINATAYEQNNINTKGTLFLIKTQRDPQEELRC